MPAPVWFSCSPFGTGGLATGAFPVLEITNGVGTVTWASAGGGWEVIGVGQMLVWGGGTSSAFIAPDRIAFTTGTTEILPGDRIVGETSGATGIVRFVEVLTGDWSTNNADGWIYFESITGTWNSSENIDKDRPDSDDDLAVTNGSLEGELHLGNLLDGETSGSQKFVLKDGDGSDHANKTSGNLSGIQHPWASLADAETNCTAASFAGTANLATGDIVIHLCCYYDHDNDTLDTTQVYFSGQTTDASRYMHVYTPQGGCETTIDQRHPGYWDSQHWRLEVAASNSGLLLIDTDDIRLEGLALNCTSTSGASRSTTYFTSACDGEAHVHRCVVRNTGVGGSSRIGIRFTDSNTSEVFDNVFHDFQGNAIYFTGLHDKIEAFNNTAYGGTNIYRIKFSSTTQASKLHLKNNIGDTASTNDYWDESSVGFANLGASDTNASSDSTSPDVANRSANPVYVDQSADNYLLDAANANGDVKDVGTAGLKNWRDILGNDRGTSSWDIGANEILGGTSGPLVNRQALTSLVGGVLAQ